MFCSRCLMPSRVLYRRTAKRKSTVVPGGQTKRVRKGSSRNAPMYAYQPPRVALRKLIHFVGGTPAFKVNGSSITWPNANADCICLNATAQGSGLERRSANRIYMRNLNLSWGHGDPLSSSVPYSYCVCVVYDRESRGVAPSITDVFVNTSSISLQNVYTRDRFDILYKKYVAVSPEYCWNGTVMYPQAGLSWMRTFNEVIPIERSTVYSGSVANDYTEILKGSLWLFVFNGYTASPVNGNVYTFFQLEFIDSE